MKTDSDTPLTDANDFPTWSEGNAGLGDEYAEYVVEADFARKLERDRAALIAALDDLLSTCEASGIRAHLLARARGALGQMNR